MEGIVALDSENRERDAAAGMSSPDLREQIAAIQKGLRRSGREMVLSSKQALVRGLFVLAACGLSYPLLHKPLWQMNVLWGSMVVLAALVEILLYVRLAAKHPDKFLTGTERQMLKFLALVFAVGVLLGTVLVQRAQGDLLPGVWMLLIGLAYVVVGLFSFSDTSVLGLCACLGGTVSLFLPLGWSFGVLALVLGGGSIAWSVVLRRREQSVERQNTH